MTNPLLISFEGTDGTGKSTQARLLSHQFRQVRQNAILLHEPGSTDIGEHIRDYLKAHKTLTYEAELLLFEAARAQLSRAVVQPALKSGTHVIMDRYIHSTIAYQGYGRNLDLQIIDTLNRFATLGQAPDLTFILFSSPEQRPHRLLSGDRFEDEEQEFHQRVAQAYQHLVDQNAKNIIMLDYQQTIEELQQQVWSQVAKSLQG